MEERIKERARELYDNSFGTKTKKQCAREAIGEENPTALAKQLKTFGINGMDEEMYIEYIAMMF